MNNLNNSSLFNKERTLIIEEIPVIRETVEGLVETIRTCFSSSKNKPISIQYKKGEPLIIERFVLKDIVPEAPSFITPYQIVRQYSDMTIKKRLSNDEMISLADFCSLVSDLRKLGKLVSIVVPYKDFLSSVLSTPVDIKHTFGCSFIEDSDCPPNMIVLAGSSTGSNIADIDISFVILKEE